MKHLSPGEKEVLIKTRDRHYVEKQPSRHRPRSSGSTLLVAACIFSFVASNTAPVLAAKLPAVSASTIFNEGNAAQRAGRLGPAILKYERASLLAPGDGAIAHNLGIARGKAGVSAAPVPTWQRPAYWLGFNTLAVLGSISLLLFSLHFFTARFIPATLLRSARGLATLLGVTTLLSLVAIALRWSDLHRAVIVSASPSSARIAPAANAAASFQLKPGEVVQVENSYGSFVRIRSADGHEGWIGSAEVERIVPQA